MIRYTTPTITIKVIGANLVGSNVFVSFRQGAVLLTKDNAIATYSDGASTLTLSLTQTETAQFAITAPVNIQVNWITQDEIRGATNILSVRSWDNLIDEVISYGG